MDRCSLEHPRADCQEEKENPVCVYPICVNAVGNRVKFPFYVGIFFSTRFSRSSFLYVLVIFSVTLLSESALEEAYASFAWSRVRCTPTGCLLEGRDEPTNPVSWGLFGRARSTFYCVLREKLLMVIHGPCMRYLSQQKLSGPTALFKA